MHVWTAAFNYAIFTSTAPQNSTQEICAEKCIHYLWKITKLKCKSNYMRAGLRNWKFNYHGLTEVFSLICFPIYSNIRVWLAGKHFIKQKISSTNSIVNSLVSCTYIQPLDTRSLEVFYCLFMSSFNCQFQGSPLMEAKKHTLTKHSRCRVNHNDS